MTAAEHERQTDDAYRAIGRYVVTFSHLVRIMRELVERRLAPSVKQDPVLPQIALSRPDASWIMRVFFGMCRHVGQFEEGEERVEKVLRNAVIEAIEERNSIAHGDWYVGLLDWNTESVQDPVVMRFHALRADGHEEEITYSVKALDEASDDLKGLTTKVGDFGPLALDLPVILLPTGVSKGIRVRDVWTPHGSKKQTTIDRDGPRAAEVGLIQH
jgi:hypothetical protein